MQRAKRGRAGSAMRLAAPALVALGLGIGTGQAEITGEPRPNRFWWPEQVDLTPLRAHGEESNPHGPGFDYAREFSRLDLGALKKDIATILTTSQAWWPADYGNYGPFFIRMAWHSAGTYRTMDGRGGAAGGQQRFDPLNSWPDNANLDKARRLLWPVKKKFGQAISWADLMVLAGNVALETMGFETLGFAGGRQDDWEPDLVYWGPEGKQLADERHAKGRQLAKPLAATQMGLIYVNPEGPNGKPDPVAAAHDIRVAFGRMGMDDEETVALIAGGHTFGKTHGAHKVEGCVGPEPGAGKLEHQGFGWNNACGKGNAEDTVTSGLEGAWTSAPARFTHQFLDNLFRFDWVQTRSPAGAIQWIPAKGAGAGLVPDAHVKGRTHAPIMLTTDLSLKFDPAYRKIAERFHKRPKDFEQAFARAWFKLTHRDMGPRARYLGGEAPAQAFSWQDPLPAPTGKPLGSRDLASLEKSILESGLSVPELVRTAWASASSYRDSDMRGGANGARIRLQPQIGWEANDPRELTKVLAKLEEIQARFHRGRRDKVRVSLADLIVLGGTAAIEKAASLAGTPVEVPFEPGRVDATQADTDVASFALLEPRADGFRNFFRAGEGVRSPVAMLVDKADQLALSVPEMTVLVGGMRALAANAGGSRHGILTDRPGVLTNDFFVNLLDMAVAWKPVEGSEDLYEGRLRSSGRKRWTATPVDLVFGSSSELRAIAEVYASDDAKEKFVKDFAAAWAKVMRLDRFDLGRR